MIIPFKSKQDSQDEYIVCPRAPPTVAELRNRMLQRAKVAEGQTRYRFVDDLHAAIFVQSLDLKADYVRTSPVSTSPSASISGAGRASRRRWWPRSPRPSTRAAACITSDLRTRSWPTCTASSS